MSIYKEYNKTELELVENIDFMLYDRHTLSLFIYTLLAHANSRIYYTCKMRSRCMFAKYIHIFHG